MVEANQQTGPGGFCQGVMLPSLGIADNSWVPAMSANYGSHFPVDVAKKEKRLAESIFLCHGVIYG